MGIMLEEFVIEVNNRIAKFPMKRDKLRESYLTG